MSWPVAGEPLVSLTHRDIKVLRCSYPCMHSGTLLAGNLCPSSVYFIQSPCDLAYLILCKHCVKSVLLNHLGVTTGKKSQYLFSTNVFYTPPPKKLCLCLVDLHLWNQQLQRANHMPLNMDFLLQYPKHIFQICWMCLFSFKMSKLMLHWHWTSQRCLSVF